MAKLTIHKHFCEQLRSPIEEMVCNWCDPSASMLSEEDVIVRAPKIRNQLFVRARTLNMWRSMIVLCTVVLTLLTADTLAIEGVKGGHRTHHGRPNQNVAINSTVQAGLCYKTIPIIEAKHRWNWSKRRNAVTFALGLSRQRELTNSLLFSYNVCAFSYADALALNSTGQFPHNTLPATTEDGATNGLITILDCCDGYARNLTSGGCEPRCIPGCLGGRCTAPNICTCEPGWYPQEGVCMPHCEGPCQKDAYCFSPNECACKLGYDEVNGECKPICPGGCKNGDCVAPRVCRCKPGFALQPSGDVSAIEPKKCVPVCENCRNGECTAPGLCSCREGYTNPPRDTETCIPSCPGGCIGGDCVAPGTCNCKPGYIIDSTGKCIPECPQGCPNGECVAPGVCNCKPGFAYDINRRCIPECPRGCINGECVAPGVCSCSPGFTLDSTKNCVPDCPRGCPNGECVAPGVCTCKQGFNLDYAGNCVPISSMSSTSLCRHGCGTNGTCVGPNQCICDLGYRVDPDTGRCIPSPTSFQCRNGCGPQGVCVGPDLCICDYGLAVDPDTGRCPEPRPSVPPIQVPAQCRYGCGPNGRCVGPNRCACDPGFVAEPDTGRCVPARTTQIGEPICENPCINGECTGLNQCTCKRGYVMSPHDPTRTRCVPVCVGGCPNGVCSGPNFCICNIGFRKETGVKGRQRCVPIENRILFDSDAIVRVANLTSLAEYSVRDFSKTIIERTLITNVRGIPAPVTIWPNILLVSNLTEHESLRGEEQAPVHGTKLKKYICFSNMKFLGLIFLVTFLKVTTAYTRLRYSEESGVCEKVVSHARVFSVIGRRDMFRIARRTGSASGDFSTKPKYDGITEKRYLENVKFHSRNLSEESNEFDYLKFFQYYTAYRTERDCCLLYKMSEEGTCEPICDPPCVNGKCTSPGICKCLPYYEKDLLHDHICEPICTDCEHGKCIRPYECECDEGYKMNLGWDSSTCQPICDVDCKYGYCSAPNECTCHENYIKDPQTDTCVPYCNIPCTNGECTAPDVCTCHDGYQLNSESICEPKCDNGCWLGTCTAPNTCTCHDGYHLTGAGVCEPICSQPCEMGTCFAPETCLCNNGYGLLNDSRYVCQPICEKACINGTCAAPETCTCHDGYRTSNDDTLQHVCEPYCQVSCEPYGHCTAPDTCTCFEGYRLVDKNQDFKNVSERSNIESVYFSKMGAEPQTKKEKYSKKNCSFQKSPYFAENSVCEPICNRTCVNGYCSAPGECSCNPGYKLSEYDRYSCVPICEENCVNGYCSGPNQCKCYPGYRSLKENSNNCTPFCVETCVNGNCSAPNECTCNNNYHPNEENPFVCDPTCENECHFGTCTAPNVCTCKEGFSPRNETFCEPVCKEPCVNGDCSAPDTCSCNSGYKLSQNSSYFCEPICQQSCINSRCSEPNKCTCYSGYKPLENDSYICEPICEQVCENGFCSAPNQCNCNEGYTFQDNFSSICEPVCKEPCGENGVCAAPGTCKCKEGYRPLEHETKFVCVSICELNCENGSCSLETCECNEGYSLVKQNGSICEPVCENCTNGRCISPNVCECNGGFMKKENSSDSSAECVSLCRNNCNDHGTCDENGICQCHSGWTGSYCDRPSFCVLTMDEYSNKTNMVDHVNDTIDSIFASSPLCTFICMDKIDDQTICYDKYRVESSRNYTIACLITADSQCYWVLSQHTSLPRYATVAGIMSVIVFLVIVLLLVYLLMHKYKKRRISLGTSFFDTRRRQQSLMRKEKLANTNLRTSEILNILSLEKRESSFCKRNENMKWNSVLLNAIFIIEMSIFVITNCLSSSPQISDSNVNIQKIETNEGLECYMNISNKIFFCKLFFSRQVTHYKPYIETYKKRKWGLFYKTETRVNYKLERGVLKERILDIHILTLSVVNSRCKPICKKPCGKGFCQAPDKCLCSLGFVASNVSKSEVCVAQCKTNCTNGFCSHPDHCKCNDGYELTADRLHCSPVCKTDCGKNAQCVAPEDCTCNSGYSLNLIENSTECLPVCTIPCQNGKCIGPNLCGCNAGYRPSINDSNICEPICEIPCGSNSICTEPNICACLPNYKLIENDVTHGCEPICEVDCGRNGTCTAPNVCTCNEGYVLNEESQCMAFCNSTCENSTCVEPDRCQCWDGFVPLNETHCMPFCENGCENGKCVAPNECRCDDEFVKHKNSSCIKPCTRTCKGHGVCGDDDKACECYYGWTGWDCDQNNVCILLLNADDESLNGVIVYNETNSTVGDIRRNAHYCHECNQAVGNRSLCYAMPAVDGSGFAVGCLVETESPCILMYRSNTPTVSVVTGTLTVGIILIVASTSMIAYFVSNNVITKNEKNVRMVETQGQINIAPHFRHSLTVTHIEKSEAHIHVR
ncbi:uncharacterized protein LOC143183369 [Calliopsis andreniformis]|uniref:uncharacterized protein LOC143183369 n=1 Tax=Calliopsis andreniformis TaxID=337506 RepID=UPI003FCC7BAB